MKRCTFQVPVHQVKVVSVVGADEAECREKLARDEGVEFHYAFNGTTPSGQAELVTCYDLPMTGATEGESK